MNNLLLKLYLAVQDLRDRKHGQGVTEYAMAVSVIALGTVAGESAVAQKINSTFMSVASTITTGILR